MRHTAPGLRSATGFAARFGVLFVDLRTHADLSSELDPAGFAQHVPASFENLHPLRELLYALIQADGPGRPVRQLLVDLVQAVLRELVLLLQVTGQLGVGAY